MKRSALSILVLGLAAAAAEPQVDWVADWGRAFELARETGRPVMVCINSKDGEGANERAAKTIYRDAEFVELSRSFVMVVISTRTHTTDAGATCPRFGVVTCPDHLNCWKELRNRHGEQFLIRSGRGAGEMISPQHAWFRPDGTLIRRKEYELTKEELLRRMRSVLAGGDGESPVPGDGPADGGFVDAPLDERDEAELERVREGGAEDRRAAIGNLLSTGKRAAYEALLALLEQERDAEVRADLLRAFGSQRMLEARERIELALKDRDELVRSCAAVALEELADPRSIEPLVDRIRRERDTAPRRNMVLALGACGGGAGEEHREIAKKAGERLLKTLKSDRQVEVRKYAALALRRFEGPNADLVRPKLEREAERVKDRTVRGAIVYALAYVGDTETTLPLLEELREDQNDDRGRLFVFAAIQILKGEGGDFGRAMRWLFFELRDDPARQG